MPRVTQGHGQARDGDAVDNDNPKRKERLQKGPPPPPLGLADAFVALRLGTADTESILRRFTRNNVQHPTYKALAELGKAIKTIFLCRYLRSQELRREIHEGLNVVEQWNGATDFVFFARRGEMASNRREDHEISMLALHLIQNCMVYINTLMIQRVLAQPHWQGRLTPRDYAALTPLIWEHVNPYGRFELDMNVRLALL